MDWTKDFIYPKDREAQRIYISILRAACNLNSTQLNQRQLIYIGLAALNLEGDYNFSTMSSRPHGKNTRKVIKILKSLEPTFIKQIGGSLYVVMVKKEKEIIETIDQIKQTGIA